LGINYSPPLQFQTAKHLINQGRLLGVGFPVIAHAPSHALTRAQQFWTPKHLINQREVVGLFLSEDEMTAGSAEKNIQTSG
jgi:hypothetical protein